MAHYAFIDEENIVTQVIVGRDETDLPEGITSWEEHYGNSFGQRCIRTSYNGNIRKNYAGIGFTYDEVLDAFIAPQPYASWILNEDTAQWEAPVPDPEGELMYSWNEELTDWEAIQFGIES